MDITAVTKTTSHFISQASVYFCNNEQVGNLSEHWIFMHQCYQGLRYTLRQRWCTALHCFDTGLQHTFLCLFREKANLGQPETQRLILARKAKIKKRRRYTVVKSHPKGVAYCIWWISLFPKSCSVLHDHFHVFSRSQAQRDFGKCR
jgi:hypothetical protein